MASTARPQWDNESKTPDRERPFHRVRFKQFDPTGTKQGPDGDGINCGCSPKKQFVDIENDLVGLLGTEGVLKVILAGLLGTGVEALFALLKAIPGAQPVVLVFNAAKEMLLDTARKLHPKAVRAIPQWVPVNRGARNDAVDPSQVVEIEGYITRSYQTAIEPPLFQWRHFYAWSLHIHPESGYGWVAADTPNPPSTKDLDFEKLPPEEPDDMEPGERAITQKRSVECLWDSGALWQDRSMFDRGLADDIEATTFAKAAQKACGPMFQADWAWPMTGQYAWAAGRWVYDCSKSTKPEPEKNIKPKMCAMIHPCKAIATARWQAFKFPENVGRVPAIQFMFFACKRGGYIDHERIDDEDYEFIVDLPDLDDQRRAEFPIGHTTEFPMNTIVVRPRLLKHSNTNAFSDAGGVQVDPIVEVLRPDQPDKPPRQARIKIPLTQMKGAEAYGVIVSLGWHDPNNVQAAKVRHCTVRIDQVTPEQVRDNPAEDVEPLIETFMEELVEEIIELPLPKTGLKFLDDFLKTVGKILSIPVQLAVKGILAIMKEAIDLLKLEKEEWLLRVGVNGRWAVFHRKVDRGGVLNLSQRFELFLDERDRLDISVSGGEIDDIGEVLHKARGVRVLAQGGRVVSWAEIANSNTETRRKLILEYVNKLMPTWANENEPLGFLDPRVDPNLKITDYNYGQDSHNPLWMDDKPHPMGANAGAKGAKVGSPAAKLELKANFARAVAGAQCVYVEDPTEEDYTLEYHVLIAAQNLPQNTKV